MNAVVDHVALLEAPVTKDGAPAAIEQLRAARIAGQVDERAYLTRADYLHGVAAGKDVEAPKVAPTMQDRYEAQIAEDMAPGKPEEYQLPRDPMKPLDDAGIEFDTELRHALTDLGVPVRLGAPIVEQVERLARELAPLDPETRQLKVESFQHALRAKWGDQYQARTAAIVDWVATKTAKHEGVGELIDAAPWILASVPVAEWLWSVIEHQKARS